MQTDYSKWYRAISARRSQRSYDFNRPVEPDLLEQMRQLCAEFRPFPSARAVLVKGSTDEVFRGLIGSYGRVKDARAFIAFVGDMDCPNVQEQVGYLGEGIILEAAAMGLATCWVGGFFRPDVAASLVGTRGNERVLAVTPVGYAAPAVTLEERAMCRFGLSHRRKPLSRMVSGLEEAKWPRWIRAALEAARLAPSAMNRQPWSFHVEPDSITVSVTGFPVDLVVSRRLDAGIAMLHIEVAALSHGVQGGWEYLENPQVARFRVG
ncbi:MAG: nitroreductase [Chloroflexi bacterium]|nr:nitroreductase [Chloroflexota bacterium]